ncbi:MAG TPA: hypothetical protein GX406_04515 [Pseudoclavibacter sp.]|nr:hypothetical protein [Pseudoclavibacter sp.]
MSRVPDVLTTEHFADAELQVLARDGFVRRVGRWYCPAYLPDSPKLRAQTIYEDFSTEVIADTFTAAWVYRCNPRLPDPLTGLIAPGARPSRARRRGRVRNARIDPHDYARLGGLAITTPARTLIDLGRAVPQRGEPGYVLRELYRSKLIGSALAVTFRLNPVQLAQGLLHLHNVPHAKRALAYLEDIVRIMRSIEAYSHAEKLAGLHAQLANIPDRPLTGP